MNLQTEGILFIAATDYLEKKYSAVLHPSEYDKIQLTKLVIKQEITHFLLNQPHTTIQELKNVIDHLFEFLYTLDKQVKLYYSEKVCYSLKSEFGDYYFELYNIDFYLLSNGHETMKERGIRTARLVDSALKQIPTVLASYKIRDNSLENVLKKLFSRIPIDHYLIADTDFILILHHLIRQYINKSSIFSPIMELRRESYVYTASRDFIIRHPLYYETRYRNS
jgi:hypothetical protein